MILNPTKTMAMTETFLEMSNFDYTIDEGLEEALRSDTDVFGTHAAWNFHGKVYFSEGQFHEEVWVYGEHVATISAPSLSELMKEVCEEYGYD